MQFRVPKSIDVEDKIVGPLTIKQAVFVVGSGAIAYLLYQIITPTFLAIVLAIPFVGLGLGLAFIRINGQSFIVLLQAIFKFLTTDRFYLWQHRTKDIGQNRTDTPVKPNNAQPGQGNPLTKEKLKELSWGLDVLGKQ